jgi:hypothetical protein
MTEFQRGNSRFQEVCQVASAQLGNFDIAEMSEHKTWVVTGEWMQTWKQASNIVSVDNHSGADNSTDAADLLGTRPNASWNPR